MIRVIKKNGFSFFLISIFLLFFPPIYLIPFLSQSVLLTSHILSKLILFILFFAFINNLKDKKYFYTASLFLFILSLSIIPAGDIFLFVKSFQNYFFGLIIFCLSAYFLTDKQKLNQATLFMLNLAIFGIIMELLLIVLFPLIKNALSYIIQKEVFSAFIVDNIRGRASFLNNNIALSPFIFICFLNDGSLGIKNKKNYFKLIIFFSLILVFIEGFISNVRTKFLQLIFLLVSIGCNFVFHKDYRCIAKRKFFLLIYIFIFSFIVFLKLYHPYNYEILDRILITEDLSDLKSVDFRIKSFERSFELFNSSILLGIGLGNYSFSNAKPKIFSLLRNTEENIYFQRVQQSPHNVFLQFLSETGLFGFLFFIFLLFSFIMQDSQIIFKKNTRYKNLFPFILSSWCFLFYGFFNPFETLYIMGLFWFLRGAIYACVKGS